ncbi:MAG: hypothetical protein IPP07_16650 [Holophagales bacterium]|jgi:hypothetical protein|nr:hypothetical protein [Holophagales bacterium]MBK9966426.1 hypothetical protein [Holophagales bacterium]
MRNRFWPVLAILFLATCRKPQAGTGRVVVSSDPEVVAAARATWEARRARLLADLLANPARIRSYDTEATDLIRAHRPESLRKLRQLGEDNSAPPEKRLQALLALRFLGEPPAVAKFVALANASPAAAVELTQGLFDLYPDGSPLPVELRRCLAGWVSSTDLRLRKAALWHVGRLRVREATEAVSRQLPSAAKTDNALFLAAARLQPSAELLSRLASRLGPAERFAGPAGLDAITALGEATDDPALRSRAAATAARYLAKQENQSWIDGESLGAIDAIASVQPPAEAEKLLAELVASARWEAVRHSALEHLAKRDRPAAEELSRRTGVALGENERPGRKGEPGTPTECARILVEEEVLTRAEADAALAKLSAEGDPDESGLSVAESLLESSGRLVAFDTETGMVPNRHDRLLLEFASASTGRFRPEATLEDYVPSDRNPDEGSYEVRFVHSGRLYDFKPADLGDWYDVDAVVEAIHRALADDEVPDRFLMIDTGDQMAVFAFGPAASLTKACGRLGLPLAANLGKPREAGKAFEERVLGEMKK